MKEFWKRFWQEEDGVETIEIIVIVAILVTIALIFRKTITGFVEQLMKNLFGENNSNAKEWVDTTAPTTGG